MSTALISSRGAQHPRRWTPAQLGTLSLWLDADDATTITIATGVSQWNDKSGNGRHVSQETGVNQPTYVTNAQNGRSVLRFVGPDDTMGGGDVLDLGTGGLSVAAASVTTEASSGTTTAGLIVGKSTAAGNLNGTYGLNRNGLNAYMGGTNRNARDTVNPQTFTITAGVLDRSQGNTSWRNGTQVATVTTGFPDTTDYNIINDLQVSGRGSLTAPSLPLNGDVGEIVLSLTTWTTTERQQVEGYLAHKWGTSASLPSDHPYKSVAP